MKWHGLPAPRVALAQYHRNVTQVPTETELDIIATLLLKGRGYRDEWLPLAGRRKSGFKYLERTVDPLQINQVALDSRQLSQIRLDLVELLRDPSNHVYPATSAEYPTRIRDLDGRPALLFVRGTLESTSRRTVAIVGSRDATSTGTSTTRRLASQISSDGHTVISGLARGIDTASHNGALDGGGSTIAVMGTGLGIIHPKENFALADRIVKRGALVTQFPPGYAATKTTFPARNSLIAGMSDMTIVVEMKESSGTRIEVNCALEQGRVVLFWAPLLYTQPWARKFVSDSRVKFVESYKDVSTELEQL